MCGTEQHSAISSKFKLANKSFVTALLTQPLKVHFILDPFKPPIHHILSGSMHRHTRVFMPSDILSKKAPFIFFSFIDISLLGVTMNVRH